MLSASEICRSMALVSGSVNYFYLFNSVSEIAVVKPKFGGQNRRICSFPDAIFVRRFGNNVYIVVEHYDNNPFWISADTNRNDLK